MTPCMCDQGAGCWGCETWQALDYGGRRAEEDAVRELDDEYTDGAE